MPKKSLKEQIQSIEYRDADTEDFDDIIDTTPEKVTSSAKNKITMLPLEKLVEYKDENFEKIAGRPQPFREYSRKKSDKGIKNLRINRDSGDRS